MIQITADNPYQAIVDIITDWCRGHGFDDFLVKISIDGEETTELLLYDGCLDEFQWETDWYEGQDVCLLGFRPLSEFQVHGFPPFNTNGDGLRDMSDEKLAKWLGDMIFPQCLVCPATDEPWCLDRDCFTVMLAWLRARAEGGADDGGY